MLIVPKRLIRMLTSNAAEEDPEPVNIARKGLMAYPVLNGFKQISWDLYLNAC